MKILDDVVTNAKSVANELGKKAGKAIDISKLKISAAEITSEINKLYRELGNLVFLSKREGADNEIAVENIMNEIEALTIVCTRPKELTRAAGILMENRDRGTDLWEKLAEQSEALWTERKRAATEKIRLAESKMSFPLGIMLMALIIITAAPAMMQIR